MLHFCPSVVFWNNMKVHSDLAAKVKDRSKYYFQPSPRNCTSSLSLSYHSLYICLPGETMFPWDMLKWRGRKKIHLSLLQVSWHFFLYPTFWLCWRCKRKSHISSLLVCSRTQRTCTRLAVLRSSSGWSSIEPRQAPITEKSCRVVLTSLWSMKKSFRIYSWWFFSPWGIPAGVCMQYNIQGDSHEEQSRTLKISGVFSEL